MRLLLAHLLALAAAACTSGEDIRARDRDGVLFSGRARFTTPVTASGKARLGAEVGAFGSNADFTSPTGRKDYRIAVGYGAVVADINLGPLHLLPKVGVGLGDFAVAGQARSLREDGLGLVLGIEGRYPLSAAFGAFMRGTTFHRSSLDSGLLEAGVAWQPSAHIAVELGYGLAANEIQEAIDPLDTSDSADVETHGLLLSMTLSF